MGQSVCRALTADSTATRNIQGAEASLLVLGARTVRDVPSEAQHSYALFPDIIDA